MGRLFWKAVRGGRSSWKNDVWAAILKRQYEGRPSWIAKREGDQFWKARCGGRHVSRKHLALGS